MQEVNTLTIKQRLFISNILMIVLPIIFTIIMFFFIYFVFVGTTGMNPFSIGQNRGSLIVADELRANMLLQSEAHTQITRDVVIYQSESGAYLLVLPGSVSEHFRGQDIPPHVSAVMFFTLLIIIFIINRLLTKYISGHIMTAIDTLVSGVSEIRDGNLDYRIEYSAGDEFNNVCGAFNEMAERLLDMVHARQLDEKNRKELIAGISHDLRTPLTSIKTYVEGIELGMAQTPELQKEYLDTIKNKTNDIEHIINQLFMFSKLDIGEFPMILSQADAGDWISDFVEAVSAEYAGKGLKIRLNENIRGTMFSVDSVQLGNVLTNIFENSIKYGNKENGIMDISCRKENSGVVITLTDNGKGVPDEHLERLFDVFYRTDKARNNTVQGSGLGLAVSAKILERLGGGIRAENAGSGGLSIILKLPAVKGDE